MDCPTKLDMGYAIVEEVIIRRGQASGFVDPDACPMQVAHFVVLMHEGVLGMLKGLGDPATFQVFFTSVRTYLRSLEVPS